MLNHFLGEIEIETKQPYILFTSLSFTRIRADSATRQAAGKVVFIQVDKEAVFQWHMHTYHCDRIISIAPQQWPQLP